jgi:hypothetical protein
MPKYKIRLHDITGSYETVKTGRSIKTNFLPPKPDKKFTKTYDSADKNLLTIAGKLRDEYGYDTFYIDPARKSTKKTSK